MKKMLAGLFSVLLAAATAFAQQANEPKRTYDPMYHWFNENGQYIGYLTLSSQQAICNAATTIECRKGYNEIDFDEEGNEVPGGPVEEELFKVSR